MPCPTKKENFIHQFGVTCNLKNRLLLLLLLLLYSLYVIYKLYIVYILYINYIYSYIYNI
jgi:hypothetical protein